MRDATNMVKAGDIVELKSSRLSGMIGYITKEDGHMVINGLSPEMDNQHVDMQYIPSDEINRVYRGDFSRDLERLAKNRTASLSAGFWAYDNLKNHLEQTRPVLDQSGEPARRPDRSASRQEKSIKDRLIPGDLVEFSDSHFPGRSLVGYVTKDKDGIPILRGMSLGFDFQKDPSVDLADVEAKNIRKVYRDSFPEVKVAASKDFDSYDRDIMYVNLKEHLKRVEPMYDAAEAEEQHDRRVQQAMSMLPTEDIPEADAEFTL